MSRLVSRCCAGLVTAAIVLFATGCAMIPAGELQLAHATQDYVGGQN